RKLYEHGVAINKPEIYAKGMLALFTSKDYNLTKGLNILLDQDVKKIAVANAKTAPYGVITKEALINAKLYKKIEDKLIYGESIGQTLTFTLKAADIGIVAKTNLYSKELSGFKKGKNWIDLDSNLYTPTKQGIVIIKRATNLKEARLFYNYILSKPAKEIFKKYGYLE
ncbi:MAG: molybdate ABC transporter substrate-binding protein, partial [Aquificaceae bacterium]